MTQYEIRISGKVQGVGFRFFTQQQAKALNLVGWVRNTLDGGVLANVRGPKHALDTFYDHMWIGPPHADVKSVTKVEVQQLEEYDDFLITR
jgi:acylphosphatase